MATKRCNACLTRRPEDQTALVQRKVGGSYNRAAHWARCIICRDCVEGYLLRTVRRGVFSVDRWSASGLRHAGENMGLPVPPREPKEG